MTFLYRFNSEGVPATPLKLKVETNTREHFSVYGLKEIPFRVSSRWFEGSCSIQTYTLDELLGTKLRALYQRRRGRDLFDLAIALKSPDTNPLRVIETFSKYTDHGGHNVTRAQFEENLALKLEDRQFMADIGPLLAPGYEWAPEAEAAEVSARLIELLPGDPWKGDQ